MKTIVLTRGKVALVDDSDFEAVSAFKWYAEKAKRRLYACRNVTRADGSRTKQRLHRFLMPEAPEVDHEDGDGLNNQRNNLRPATTRQNAQGFQRRHAGTASQFRGVTWPTKYSRWEARICVNGKQIFLGIFPSEISAARAYDVAAIKFFKEFACPNFPV